LGLGLCAVQGCVADVDVAGCALVWSVVEGATPSGSTRALTCPNLMDHRRPAAASRGPGRGRKTGSADLADGGGGGMGSVGEGRERGSPGGGGGGGGGDDTVSAAFWARLRSLARQRRREGGGGVRWIVVPIFLRGQYPAVLGRAELLGPRYGKRPNEIDECHITVAIIDTHTRRIERFDPCAPTTHSARYALCPRARKRWAPSDVTP
jgi:hypothetical protein